MALGQLVDTKSAMGAVQRPAELRHGRVAGKHHQRLGQLARTRATAATALSTSHGAAEICAEVNEKMREECRRRPRTGCPAGRTG